VLLLAAALEAFASEGLTLQRFNNTAFAGPGLTSTVLSSLEDLDDCAAGTCGQSSSILITGRIAPTSAGKYGFEVTFSPPLPYPSPEAYARLWVHDHLLYPKDTCRMKKGGTKAAQWLPLPPRALDSAGRPVEHPAAANLTSYEVRSSTCAWHLPAATSATSRTAQTPFAASTPTASPSPPFAPIPRGCLVSTRSVPEIARRSLATRMQDGWGTFYSSSMFR
jgi:hypothetical protein